VLSRHFMFILSNTNENQMSRGKFGFKLNSFKVIRFKTSADNLTSTYLKTIIRRKQSFTTTLDDSKIENSKFETILPEKESIRLWKNHSTARTISKTKFKWRKMPSIQQRLKTSMSFRKNTYFSSSQGESTRPMMGKLRSALFDMIKSVIGEKAIINAKCLDLFAGTGAVGIEFLTRGCREVVFVENDPWICSAVLLPNINTANAQLKSSLHMDDVISFLKHDRGGSRYDIIFCCPPYCKISYPVLIASLDKSPLMSDKSYLVIEFPSGPAMNSNIPKRIGPLLLLYKRAYGRTKLAVYGSEIR